MLHNLNGCPNFSTPFGGLGPPAPLWLRLCVFTSFQSIGLSHMCGTPKRTNQHSR